MSRQIVCMITLAALIIISVNCVSRRMYIIKHDINAEELENVGKVHVTLTDGSTITFSKIEIEDDKLKGTTDTGQSNKLNLQDIESMWVERRHGRPGTAFLSGVLSLIPLLFFGFILGSSA